MKRAVLLAILAGAVACLSSCGNYNSNTSLDQFGNPIYGPPGGNKNSKHPVSNLNLRAFVTDQFNSVIRIVDAKFDGYYGAVINTTSGPTLIQLTSDKTLAVLFATGNNTFQGVDIANEATTGSVTLPSWTEDFVIAPDKDTVYAAVRNAPVTSGVTGAVPGALEVVGLTAAAITHTVFIPKAHWLALSHNGSKLLVFSDDSNSLTVVNTSDLSTTTVAGFDHPVRGVFSSDDSTAYILSCGAECGGTQASVTALSMSNNTPAASVAVEGATMALLDGSNLYVAGTGAGGGKLDIVSVPGMTVSKSGISITDGYHWRMMLANGQLFLGARNCSNTANGCLAIYNTTSGNSILAAAPGDVTGMDAIPNRSVVYVVQGGELVIYDTTTDLPQKTQLDIVGKAYDVRYVD